MKFLHCLVVLVVLSLTCCYGDKEHDDDYIDPFDMVNFDPVTKTMKNKENKEKEEKNQENKVPKNEKLIKDEKVSEEEKVTNDEKVTSDKLVHNIPPVSTTHSPQVTNKKREDQKPPDRNPGSVLFRKFVKKLISYFQSKAPDTTQEYHVWVKLSKDQYGVLQKFADGNSNIHDAQEILVSMITDVTRSNVGTAAKLSMWFEEKTGASLDNVLKMVTIMSLISMVLYMEIGLHISWRRRVTQLIMLSFVISIPMTWYELYQTAQINQNTVTMKEAPKECVQDMEKEDWLTFYTHAFKHIFTFQEDNCQKYYEHMLIDPLLKVTPTKAIAVTFVRFFLSPLKDIGTAFSEFMRALLIDLPVTLYPVAIVTLSMFFFLFLFMWFGYSIRLPFWMSIEPSPVVMVAGGGTTDNTQAIEDVKKQEMSGKQITAWHSHCIRTVHQDKAKQDILSNLKPNEVLVIMDLAMKFIPFLHREKQADFFGKKGMSWHFACAVTKPKDQLELKCFIHILDDGVQGWFTVANILSDVMVALKKQNPMLTCTFLKSDNAGCYHCGSLLAFIQAQNLKGAPIQIKQYNFSEAQSGKDLCDSKTSHSKLHILRYADEGHDVTSPFDMKQALESYGGLRGHSHQLFLSINIWNLKCP
ncbi:Hypothetical predicted protein [Mytilus galloprovincialis]|nr:Hypothetical predicted protein [Mytilus galloprovincialis]